MPSQLDFSNPQSGGGAVDVGSVFGVDATVSGAPVLLERGTPGTMVPDKPAHRAFGVRIPGTSKTVGAKPAKVGTVFSSVQGFYALDPNQQAEIADRMEAAGYLAPLAKNRRRNPRDVANAWKLVVIDAARSGNTITEVLDDAAASADASGAGSGRTATIPLTSTEDLRSVFRQVFTKNLGVGPDEATLDRMIAAYHGKELGAGTAALAGGVAEGAPSASTFAENYAKQTQPVRFGARGVVKVASVIEQMLGGQLPSTSQQMPGVS